MQARGRADEGAVCTYSDGPGAGTGSLTWAQQFMREVVLATGAAVGDFDFLIVHDLAEPLSIGMAQDLVRRFVLRHPLLRTSISETADGTPVQRISAAGILPISVHRTDDPFADELRDVVPGTTFETTFRALLVLQGDAVVRVAMRISHVVTDVDGTRLLSDAFAALAAEESATSINDFVAPSPLDLARFEESIEGQRIQRRAIDHASAVYEVSPPTMLPRRRTPEGMRFWFGELRSADLLLSMPVLRNRLGVTRAGALAGSLAAVVASQAGTQSALLFLISSNRFDPAWTSYPGLLTQEAILHLPIGESIRETMQVATTASMRSLRNARYSPAEMDKVRRAAERRHGVRFDKLGTAVVLNLLSPDGSLKELDRTPSTFRWKGATNAENLGLYIDAYQDTDDFVLHVRVDTALMAPDDAKDLLRAMEWLIVTCAARDLAIDELHLSDIL